MSILKERQKTHGEYANVARIAQSLKAILQDGPSYDGLTLMQRESLDLICTKLSRIVCGAPEKDHWVDLSGYADLIVFNEFNQKKSASGKTNIFQAPEGFSDFDASKHFPDPYLSVMSDIEWSR